MRSFWLVSVLFAACAAPLAVPDGGDRPREADGGGEPEDAGALAPPEDAGVLPDAGLTADAGPGVDAGHAAPTRWPIDPDAVTHDVDRDLSAVLEAENLAGACEQVRAGAMDRPTRLRCGKWMFFYESFGTQGAPAPLLDFLQKYYAGYYGEAFTSFGFIADPASTTHMPLGLAPTPTKLGSVEARAFTCASCHFGQLPDGRYAVGFANQRLDYGHFLASLAAPVSLSFNLNDASVHPTLRAELGPAVTAARQQPGYSLEVGGLGLQLLGAGTNGQLSVDEQDHFLHWRTGTMDFLTKPVLDDGVWAVSRILSLWNIPTGTPHEWLSWNGGVPHLEDFLAGFVVNGKSPDPWTAAQLAPLAEYLRTLRPPPLETPPGDVSEGARLFVDLDCLGCHDGPSGESSRTFSFSEVGTDAAYANIYAPDANGEACCGLGLIYVTREVKAPRMAGLAFQTRWLHDGALSSLEELFCVTPRPMVMREAQGAGGHDMTCSGLTLAQKQALIAYLKTL